MSAENQESFARRRDPWTGAAVFTAIQDFAAVVIAIQETIFRTAVEIFSDSGLGSVIDMMNENKDARVRARNAKPPKWLVMARILGSLFGLFVILTCIILLIVYAGIYYKYGDMETYSNEYSIVGQINRLEHQISDLDGIVEDVINSVRKELDGKMEKEEDEMDWKWTTLNLKSDVFEKFINGFGTKALLSKEEFDEFFEEFRKTGGEISVDHEIRDYVRQNEIGK